MKARYREAIPNIVDEGGVAKRSGPNKIAPTEIAQLNKIMRITCREALLCSGPPMEVNM
jgi:hypothetical protein